MTALPDPIRAVVSHLDSVSCCRSSRLAVSAWARRSPRLAEWSTPAEVAAALRAANSVDQDRLVADLLAVADGDDLAQLTVVAGLAARLSGVVSGWRRAGVAPADLDVMATDLVSSAWTVVAGSAVGPVPARAAWHVVDEAREQVRVPRRRDRRASALAVRLDDASGVAGSDRWSCEERLTVALVDAVREGRITRGAASSVFMTRVAGWGVAETAARMGRAEVSVRVARMRAERRLVAAA